MLCLQVSLFISSSFYQIFNNIASIIVPFFKLSLCVIFPDHFPVVQRICLNKLIKPKLNAKCLILFWIQELIFHVFLHDLICLDFLPNHANCAILLLYIQVYTAHHELLAQFTFCSCRNNLTSRWKLQQFTYWRFVIMRTIRMLFNLCMGDRSLINISSGYFMNPYFYYVHSVVS